MKNKISLGYYRLKDEFRYAWLSTKMNIHIFREANRMGDVFIIDRVISNEGYSRKMKVISEREMHMFRKLSKVEEYNLRFNTNVNVVLEDLQEGVLVKRAIVGAAVSFTNGVVCVGAHHYDCLMRSQMQGLIDAGVSLTKDEELYIDQFGKLYSKEEAKCIAYCNSSCTHVYIQED